MAKLPNDVEKLMVERFGRDCLISLATAVGNTPYVRTVNSFYEDGSFYVLTYGLSGKMEQIRQNPVVAIAGDWFTAHGRAVNMGWFAREENRSVAAKMRQVFASWIDNGHNNFEDENTCILRIDLTDGLLLSHGTRHEIHLQA